MPRGLRADRGRDRRAARRARRPAPAHARPAAAGQLRKALAKHQDIELLLQLGEYKRGSDPDADFAIDKIGPIRKLLQQGSSELVPFAQSSDTLRKLFA